MGRIIVIEGTDGSGKKEQALRLTSRLREAGNKVSLFDFPIYKHPTGAPITYYLNNGFKELGFIDPRVISAMYAINRLCVRKEIISAVNSGIVICNRYVTSNKGHQASKTDNEEEFNEIIDFIDYFEYKLCELPREDAAVLLLVHPLVSQRLMALREKDSHEENIDYLKRSYDTYKKIASREGWIVIDCMRGSFSDEELTGKPIEELLFSISEINDVIYNKIKDII